MTYELVNTITANTVGCFSTEAEAREALDRFRATNEQFAGQLAVVAFDDDGHVVDAASEADVTSRAEVVEAFGHGRA